VRDLDAFAAALDLDLSRTQVCYACLSFVSSPLEKGDLRAARGWARRMTPSIWEEGLAEPALAAVRKARDAGLRGAGDALAELERTGGRSAVARAIVLRLAADLTRRTRIEMHLEAAARERLDEAPPEWN
jgi:hypothetical protein